MAVSLRVFLIVSCVIFFCVVTYMLRRDKLNLKYTLVWLLTSLVMLLFSIFPELAFSISALIGIVEPANAVFLFAIFFILLILFTFTVIITRVSARIRKLAQDAALLEARVRELEDRSSNQME